MDAIPSKVERLTEFFRRLKAVEPASSFEEAYEQLCTTLDQVEDELSGLPNEPDRWMVLDRMFPPQSDRMSSISCCDVKRFDNLKHITYIAANGAIEVRSKRPKQGVIDVHFSKAGSDGRFMSEFCEDLAHKNI